MRLLSIAPLCAVAIRRATASPALAPRDSSNTTLYQSPKRDPCNGLGASFELGRWYWSGPTTDCPTLNEQLPDGACDWRKKQPGNTQCAFFCQVVTQFMPMQEVPIPNTYCRGPNKCWIPHDHQIQVPSLWSGSAQDAYAFDHGISGGFSPGARTLTAGPGDIDIAEGECGYFTWIGTKKTVCGTLTEANRPGPFTPGESFYCQAPTKTTPNVCVSDIWAGPDDDVEAFGHTVFVHADCETRLPLPKEKQDPLFMYVGVAMPTDQLDEVLQAQMVRTYCYKHYMGLWYDWEMQGRGLKDSQLGPSGINLLRDIGGCGATVTTWKFIWTPENGIYDWRASGGVDILKDECLGAALLAVGGNDRGRCSGTKANVLWPTDFS